MTCLSSKKPNGGLRTHGRKRVTTTSTQEARAAREGGWSSDHRENFSKKFWTMKKRHHHAVNMTGCMTKSGRNIFDGNFKKPWMRGGAEELQTSAWACPNCSEIFESECALKLHAAKKHKMVEHGVNQFDKKLHAAHGMRMCW